MQRPRWDAEPGSLLGWAYLNLGEVERAEYRRYCQGGPLPDREEKRRISSVRQIAPADRAALAGKPCVYCGADADSVDHVLAVTRGGTSHPDNLAPACWPCNKLKGALSAEEFRAAIAEFTAVSGSTLAEARSVTGSRFG